MKLLAKFLFFFLLFPIASFGQIEKPVTWKFLAEERNGETYIVAKATIQKGWHVYSQKVPNDGPLPTTFSLVKGKEFSPQGKVLESKPIEKMDNVFGAVIRYFEDKAEFSQKIKPNSDKDFVVKGSIEFMACNDNSCLPPDLIEFELNIKGKPLEKKKLTP